MPGFCQGRMGLKAMTIIVYPFICIHASGQMFNCPTLHDRRRDLEERDPGTI